MKKLLIIAVMAVMAATAFAAPKAGVGFELGTNFVNTTGGTEYNGASNNFTVNFKLSDDMSIGYYRESGKVNKRNSMGAADIAFDANAIQVTKKVIDLVGVGIRVGSVTTNATAAVGDQTSPYGSIFAKITPVSGKTEAYEGSMNFNLGYEFAPMTAWADGIGTDFKDFNHFSVGINAGISF